MDIYEKTAQHLIDNGWIKGQTKDKDGQCCLIGALQQVVGYKNSLRDRSLPREVAMELFPERTKGVDKPDMASTHGNLVQFNDHPDTVLADILIILQESSKRSKA